MGVIEKRLQLCRMHAVQCSQSSHGPRPYGGCRVCQQWAQKCGIRTASAFGQPDDRTRRHREITGRRAPLSVPGCWITSVLTYDISCTGPHERGPVAEKRFCLFWPSRMPQSGDASGTGARMARRQQWKQDLLIGVAVPEGCECCCCTQILDHSVVILGGCAGQLGGTQQSAFDSKPVGESSEGAVRMSKDGIQVLGGALAQDLSEHIDAESTPVTAADAEDEWCEVESQVHVQSLAEQLTGVFTHGANPVGAADHDQREQVRITGRLVQRLLTDSPVAVTKGKCQL